MTLLVVCTIAHYLTTAQMTATTALRQLDAEFEAAALSLKAPLYRHYLRVTVPICLPALLDIVRYLFVSAMTTVSAAIFLYSPDTIPRRRRRVEHGRRRQCGRRGGHVHFDPVHFGRRLAAAGVGLTWRVAPLPSLAPDRAGPITLKEVCHVQAPRVGRCRTHCIQPECLRQD